MKDLNWAHTAIEPAGVVFTCKGHLRILECVFLLWSLDPDSDVHYAVILGFKTIEGNWIVFFFCSES